MYLFVVWYIYMCFYVHIIYIYIHIHMDTYILSLLLLISKYFLHPIFVSSFFLFLFFFYLLTIEVVQYSQFLWHNFDLLWAFFFFFFVGGSVKIFISTTTTTAQHSTAKALPSFSMEMFIGLYIKYTYR